ncbi:MAG TPA: DUF3299 domain-containing protein [Tepidisphaeraceae bacterium]|jgi:hypothetical protein
MRRTLLIVALLAAPVLADAVSDELARADQAFAAGDYKTAASLYGRLDSKLTDAGQKAATQERLRFATKQLSNPAAAPAASPATLPAAGRKPHVRPADGQTLALTLHELGNFEFNEEDDKSIPDDVRKLDGAKVKIEGVMLPLDQAGRVTRFMLVNDMMSCCYGQSPKLQNVALVEMPKDKWMAATTNRISIEGTLRVKVKRDDGFVMSIFEVAPTSIKFAAP